MKHLMSGNEATARGVYEAGIKVCSAYPGTPSTEILENLPQYKEDVYCEWAPNEKVATEVAYGAAVAGSRSICTMKMVAIPPRTSRTTATMPAPPRSPWSSPAIPRSARTS